MLMKYLSAFALVVALLGLTACKKSESPTSEHIITLQLSLESGFPGKSSISEVVIILDSRNPSEQIVYRAQEPRASALGGFPVRWEYKDIDNDQAI